MKQFPESSCVCVLTWGFSGHDALCCSDGDSAYQTRFGRPIRRSTVATTCFHYVENRTTSHLDNIP